MRVFVALPLPAALGRQLTRGVQAALGAHLDELRLVSAEDLHLTLHFLGEASAESVERLRAALTATLAGAQAPSVWIRGTGSFPSGSRSRVLWIGTTEDSGNLGRLAELHGLVLRAVKAAGHPLPDPPEGLLPHITVARPRARAGMSLPRAFRELVLGLPWRAAEVALLESRAANQDTRYPALQTWLLG